MAEVIFVIARDSVDAIGGSQLGQRRNVSRACLQIAIDQVACDDDQIGILGIGPGDRLFDPGCLEQAADM